MAMKSYMDKLMKPSAYYSRKMWGNLSYDVVLVIQTQSNDCRAPLRCARIDKRFYLPANACASASSIVPSLIMTRRSTTLRSSRMLPRQSRPWR